MYSLEKKAIKDTSFSWIISSSKMEKVKFDEVGALSSTKHPVKLRLFGTTVTF